MNNTIFDDVFRTMVEKIPQLAIPLINEVFQTSYPENGKMEKWKYRDNWNARSFSLRMEKPRMLSLPQWMVPVDLRMLQNHGIW